MADGALRWYMIHTGVVQAVLPVPTDPTTAAAALNKLETVFSNGLTATRKLERCVDSVLIVTGWFRKRPDEKPKLLTTRQATNLCRAMMESASADG